MDIRCKYEIIDTNNTILSVYKYDGIVPFSVDFQNNKIYYNQLIVNYIGLTQKNKYSNVDKVFDFEYRDILKDKLVKFIELNKIGKEFFDYDYREVLNDNYHEVEPQKDYENIKIFLQQNPHLKSEEFYYWDDVAMLKEYENVTTKDALMIIANNPKAKSIRKAIYKLYDRYLSADKYYIVEIFDTVYIKTIIRLFNNIDYIRNTFTKIDFAAIFQNDTPREYFFDFILLLKRYYEEKQIYKLLYDNRYDEDYLLGIVCMLEEYKIYIVKNFTKVKCNIVSIYNEMERCTKIDELIEINYNQLQINRCVTIDNFMIKLPMTNHELNQWADLLKNCLAKYINNIFEAKTTIYAFFENQNIQFVVRIEDNKIMEAKQKFNKDLSIKQQEILEKWILEDDYNYT